MRPGTLTVSCILLPVGLAAAIAFGPAYAANADFQGFFTNVCAGTGVPTGTLATRCAETGNGTGDGDLSGDSESSLNPSQTLSSNDSALAVARSRSQETRERGERLREGDAVLSEEAASQTFGRLSLLANVRGEWFQTDRPAGGDPDRGYDGNLWALEAGMDYRVTERTIVGGIISYERTDADFDRDLQAGAPFTPASEAGSMESDSFGITLFSSFTFGESLYLDLSGGYRATDYTFKRKSVFQESGRSTQTSVLTKGEPDGHEWWGSFNLGYDWQRGEWSFGPYAGLTYTTTDVDSYSENDLNNSGLAMRISNTDSDSNLAHLGFRGSYVISSGNGVWIPQFRVEYDHDFDDDPLNVDSIYELDAAQTLYPLKGNDRDSDYFSIALGIAGVLPNGWIPYLDGETLLGYDDVERFRVNAGLRKEF